MPSLSDDSHSDSVCKSKASHAFLFMTKSTVEDVAAKYNIKKNVRTNASRLRDCLIFSAVMFRWEVQSCLQ